MKRRAFLGGALTSLVAGLVPASVLSRAVALHNVEIDIDDENIGTMRLDGGEAIPLKSMVLRKRFKYEPIREVGNRIMAYDNAPALTVTYQGGDDADMKVRIHGPESL